MTRTWTSPSPARASPGCGRPTTWPGPTRGCGSRSASGDRRIRRVWAQRRLVLGPVPRVAGEAGADGGPDAGDRDAPGHAADRRRGRPRAAAEGIDCHWAKGGTVQLARSAAQLERAPAEVARGRRFGFGSDDLRLLTAAEAGDLAARRRARRHLHPALRGDPSGPAGTRPGRRGTPPRRRRVRANSGDGDPARTAGTPAGTVRARYVIRATEGYTPQLPGSSARWCRSTR